MFRANVRKIFGTDQSRLISTPCRAKNKVGVFLIAKNNELLKNVSYLGHSEKNSPFPSISVKKKLSKVEKRYKCDRSSSS